MLICEALDPLSHPPTIQIFATDIDDEAIAVARAGLYPHSIAGDVSPERLKRFFRKEAGGYRVTEELTESILFAHHNLLKDPPFSRLDLVTCRNVLIYFNRRLQERVLSTFHYALSRQGRLVLGSSETAKTPTSLFETLDKTNRIYAPSDVATEVPAATPRALALSLDSPRLKRPTRASVERPAPDMGELHRQALVRLMGPPSVLVTRDYEVRHYEGDIGRYLRPVPGAPSHNLLQMVGPTMRAEVQSTLFRAFRQDQDVETNVRLEDGSSVRVCASVSVLEAEDGRDRLALVVFTDLEEPDLMHDSVSKAPLDEQERSLVDNLQADLTRLRERLQTTIEEYEISAEELRASNEELQSMNEETRSLAEELETSKEEIQSTNEELVTVNAELQAKVDQLGRTSSDLENLMHATEIGTIFLDRKLALKRYTPHVVDYFNLITSDLGRPFAHISHKLDHDTLADDAANVLDNLASIRREVQTNDGRWLLVHLLPYRTGDDRIDGIVITFIDITERKEWETEQTRRAGQQDLLATLGNYALRSTIDELLDQTVDVVHEGLNVPLSKVLQYDEKANCFDLVSGHGWHEGLVGKGCVSGGGHSQAGFTLVSDVPVIVEDLQEERRFTGPDLLFEHDVVSGVSVPIRSPEGLAWGVIGAHDLHPRDFSPSDAAFLQGVANVLGAAIGRYADEAELRRFAERFQAAIGGSPVSLFSQDRDGRYTWVYNQVDHEEDTILGSTDAELLQRAEDVQKLDDIRRRVLESEQPVREEFEAQMKASMRWFVIYSEPSRDADGSVVGTTSAALDITDVKRVESELRALTRDLEQRVDERTREVVEQSEQARRLASELTLAEQRERHRIAQVLHDDLQQLLYSLQMKLSLFGRVVGDPDKLEKLTRRFDDLLSRAITATRTLSVDLSPPVLEGEGIQDAVVWLAIQMQELHALNVHVTGDGPQSVGSHDLQVLLFQLVRELLFNIVKHAGVSEAYVTLVHDADVLTIEVRDEGVGFITDVLYEPRTEGGFGLYSVRERLPLFRGKLDVESAPGKGTRTLITLPLS